MKHREYEWWFTFWHHVENEVVLTTRHIDTRQIVGNHSPWHFAIGNGVQGLRQRLTVAL